MPTRPAPAPARPAPGAPTDMKVHKAAELQTDMRVQHSTFGAGTIVNIDTQATDDRISVRFADGTVRTLLLKFAKFKIL